MYQLHCLDVCIYSIIVKLSLLTFVLPNIFIIWWQWEHVTSSTLLAIFENTVQENSEFDTINWTLFSLHNEVWQVITFTTGKISTKNIYLK